MTLELALSLALVAVILTAHAADLRARRTPLGRLNADWRARRTPLGRLNADIAEARARRRR